jgi:iron complex outermembrane recepter protein
VSRVLLLLLTLATGIASAASAFQFDMPAQPVPAALRAFAAQTDMQLLYQYDVVKDARANRLLGRFDKADALQRLLSGTDLEVIFSGENAATIRRTRRERDAVLQPASTDARRRAVTGELPDARPGSARESAQAAGHGSAGRHSFESMQEAAMDLEEVTVTGSRIRRVVFDTLQPTLVLDRRSIEDQALVSIADAFAGLPAFGLPGNSPIGGQSGVAVGQSFVNFLGLGSQRTLTLVDGRRFVAANTPAINGATAPGLQVDLNTIPAALVERIEVVAVGGAPVYGADAVAGTVNIIRRKDFEGFSGLAQVGATEYGGAERRRFQSTYGRRLSGGRGNLAASFEVNEQGGLRAVDRDVTAKALSFQSPHGLGGPYRQVLVPNSRVVLTNFNGLPLTASVPTHTRDFQYMMRDEQGRPLQFAPDGGLVPFDPGTRTGSAVFFSGGDGLSLAETTSLLTRSERRLGSVFLDYDLSERVTLTAEGWYAHTQSRELVNQPGYNESSFSTPEETPGNVLQGPIPLRLDNPFLPVQSRDTIARNLDFDHDGAPDPTIDFDGDGVAETPGFWLTKGHQDLFRGNSSTSDQNLYRGVVGLRGAGSVAGRAFDWDVSYNHGRTRIRSRNLTILNQEFNRAIDVVTDPVSGQIRCRDRSDSACVPLNLFGAGAPGPEAAAYVTAATFTRSEIEQRVVSANANGSPLSLPAGLVRLAAGAEYRRESSAFEPDFLSSSGLARGAPLTPISGSFNTREIYLEAVVPLVGPHQLIPGVHTVELESAVRHVDHSTAGADVTWTAGLRFAVHPDVRFRGNYTESIRAPAITELFLPSTTVVALAADPCDQRLITQGPDPERRAANCASARISQPFTSRIMNATQQMTVEGNRALENEKADAWSIGIVAQPHVIPGLTVAFDWIEIRLLNAIERFDGAAVLRACYDSIDFPKADVCSRFQRDADGQVVSLRTGFLNAGVVDFAGLTADVSYDTDLGRMGALSLGLRYFYLDRLDISVTGSDRNANAGEISSSRSRAAAQLVHRKGPVRSSLHARYVGPAVFDRNDGPQDRSIKGVDAFWVFNAGVGYAFTDSVTLQLNVDNLLDQQPPYPGMAGTLGAGANGAVATYFPGVLGRSYALSLRANF